MAIPSKADGSTNWGDDYRAVVARVNALTDDGTGKVPPGQMGTGTASSSNFLRGDGTWAVGSSGIPATLVDAKGDLIVATADDTVARLAVGSTNGLVLTADSAATTGVSWGAGGSIVQRNTVTSSYTLVFADLGKVVDVNSASATVVTVPANSAVAFPTDSVIDVRQLGSGQVTIAAASGVTLDKPASLTTRTQFSRLSLHKIAADRWIVDGDAS